MTTTVVVRRVAATPACSAADAWVVIADLVAPRGGGARQELDRVAGVATSLIAAEAMRNSPIVIHGVGPRLRLYCLYDEEAILGEGVSEDALPWCPTDGDWAMSFPCPAEDLPWVQKALARVSNRITARDQVELGPSGVQEQPAKANSQLGPVDVKAFLRP